VGFVPTCGPARAISFLKNVEVVVSGRVPIRPDFGRVGLLIFTDN
jgi:hypothetical protein